MPSLHTDANHPSPRALVKRPGAVADHPVLGAGGVAGGAQVEAFDGEVAGPGRRQQAGQGPAAAGVLRPDALTRRFRIQSKRPDTLLLRL